MFIRIGRYNHIFMSQPVIVKITEVRRVSTEYFQIARAIYKRIPLANTKNVYFTKIL